MAERPILNRKVEGSTPFPRTIFKDYPRPWRVDVWVTTTDTEPVRKEAVRIASSDNKTVAYWDDRTAVMRATAIVEAVNNYRGRKQMT